MLPSSVTDHIAARIASAPLQTEPFPYFIVRELFPSDFYQEMLRRQPAREYYESPYKMGRIGYAANGEDTFVFFDFTKPHPGLDQESAQFWHSMHAYLSGPFISVLFAKFLAQVKARYAGREQVGVAVNDGLGWVRDGYYLGPHTDKAKRVIAGMFYLPETDNHPYLGTSVYTPKDPAFRCDGGPHYKYENFNRVATAPFVRNAAMFFFRNERSFHGVEPVQCGVERRTMNYYIYETLPAAT